jgi:cobalt-zinc-cadmium efflux system outer membrane protein
VQGTSTAPTLNGTTYDNIASLAETLDTSGQKRYQAAGLEAQYEAANFTLSETLLTLEQQIRDAYWTLDAAQGQTQIAQVSLNEAQRVYDLTVKQEQAGTSPHGDVVRSSIDVANARQALLTAQGAEAVAITTFNNLLGRTPEVPVQLATNLADSSDVPAAQVPSLKELNAKALAGRPLLLAAAEQVRVANYAIRQAEASRLPDLAVNYQRSLQNPIDSVTLGLSFPILDFGSISESVRSAKELKKQAEAQRLQTEQQVLLQVSQGRTALQLAIDSAAHYKKEILDPSVTLLDMARLGYRQGATGILPVIDAESTLRNARVGYINSLLAIYKAQDQLLASTGNGTPPHKK